MATTSLTKTEITEMQRNLNTIRNDVAGVRDMATSLGLPKHDLRKTEVALTKMSDAVTVMEEALAALLNKGATKGAIRDAIKDATPEQLAAIAALLNPEPEPEVDTIPEPEASPEEYATMPECDEDAAPGEVE